MSKSGHTKLGLVLATLALLAAASPAQAYIGPGAGLTAIGAFIAFVAAVVVALVSFVWFPIRRALRNARAKTKVEGEAAGDDDD
jgi:hypothetical protein